MLVKRRKGKEREREREKIRLRGMKIFLNQYFSFQINK